MRNPGIWILTRAAQMNGRLNGSRPSNKNAARENYLPRILVRRILRKRDFA
jgi:hypothetical protein